MEVEAVRCEAEAEEKREGLAEGAAREEAGFEAPKRELVAALCDWPKSGAGVTAGCGACCCCCC